MLHVSWNRDPGNVPFYRQDNDLDPTDSFSLLGDERRRARRARLVYRRPAGANVTVTFLSDQGDGARRLGRVRVLRHGTARARLALAFNMGAERRTRLRRPQRVTCAP